MKTIIGIVLALWLAAIPILGAVGAFPQPPGTPPMTQLPMLLIPAYLVPLFFMLHLAALLQVRRQPAAAARV